MGKAMLERQCEATACSANDNSSPPAKDGLRIEPMVIMAADESSERDADEAEDATMAHIDQKVCQNGF